MNETVKGIVEKYAISLDDFEKEILEFPNMECVSIFFKNEEDCKACRAEIVKDESIMVAEGWHCNIEVFSKTAGKAKEFPVWNKIRTSKERDDCNGFYPDSAENYAVN